MEMTPLNTGLIRPTTTVVQGPQIITQPQVYVDVDFQGFVDVRSDDVTFFNCLFRGGVATGYRGLVNATHADCLNLKLYHCEFIPTYPSKWISGIVGHDYEVSYSYFFNCGDGLGVFNTAAPNTPTNVVIYRNYVDALPFYTGTTLKDGVSHNDCIQVQGGWGTVIRENTLRAYYATDTQTKPTPGAFNDHRAAIMLNDNVGQLADLVIEDNYIYGGNVAVNGGGLQLETIAPYLGRIWRNRFSRDAQRTILLDVSYATLASADTGDGTKNQNVYIDDLSPVVVRRNG